MDASEIEAQEFHDKRRKDREERPHEIVAEFESMFGKLTLTERTWLIEKIRNAIPFH